MYINLLTVVLLTMSECLGRNGLLKDDVKHYTNTWLVQFTGSWEIVQNIAETEHFEILEEIENFPGLFRFRHNKHPRRGKYENTAVIETLYQYKEVEWVQQITITKSTIRSYMCPNGVEPNPLNMVRPVNDLLYDDMWYMHDCRLEDHEPILDLNIVRVWEEMKIFGKNVKILIVDSGVEFDHIDLNDNYLPSFGIDLVDNDNIPNPKSFLSKLSNHGTKCAGIISALGDNGVCGIGIAPLSKFGAVRLLDPFDISDEKEGKALSFRAEEIDISNNSWGPVDSGQSMPHLKHFQRAGFKYGIEKGRNGKGVLYVFASGNGKQKGDVCGYDYMVNNIYTIPVASATYDGRITQFSERCSAVMVTSYSGEGKRDYNIITTDKSNECTESFYGTSASAPMISGILALIIEANSNLTWRCVQHILTWTSNPYPLRKNPGWIQNKAGFWVSSDFGFGLVNAAEAVKTAKTFKTVPKMSTCVIPAEFRSEMNLTFSRTKAVTIILRTTACKSLPAEIIYIEHIELFANISYPRRGDLHIQVKSPQGTISNLLEPRRKDAYTFGLIDWYMDSVHFWGESPCGRWEITVYNKIGRSNLIGEVKDLILIIHGTKMRPQHYEIPRFYYEFEIDGNQTN